MANKVGAIVVAFFAILAILAVAVLCGGSLVLAGCCNIAGVTFNNASARDSMPAMIGNAFWGWVVAPVGLILIGLLSYAGYRVFDNARAKINGKGSEPEDQ